MKLKRRKVIKMKHGHDIIRKSGRKFTYVVSRNKNYLDKEFEDSEEFKTPSEDYQKFLDALEEVRKNCANKDANKKPITTVQPLGDGRQRIVYDIPDADNPTGKFRVELAKAEKKFEKAIKDHEAKLKEFDEVFMEEEIEIRLIKINYDDIPADANQDEMDAIFPLIDPSTLPDDLKEEPEEEIKAEDDKKEKPKEEVK